MCRLVVPPYLLATRTIPICLMVYVLCCTVTILPTNLLNFCADQPWRRLPTKTVAWAGRRANSPFDRMTAMVCVQRATGRARGEAGRAVTPRGGGAEDNKGRAGRRV